MFHNASLMIDDIEDGSPLRRGEPAAHIIYGVPLTINAAELACFLAMQKAMELGDPRVPHIMISMIVNKSWLILIIINPFVFQST